MRIKTALFTLVFVVALCGAGFVLLQKSTPTTKTDTFTAFELEAFDTISKNYWIKPGSYGQFGVPELQELFTMAASQASGRTYSLASSSRDALSQTLTKMFSDATSTDNRRTLALQTLSLVLNSLPPAGRSSLYSKQQETELRQTVSNVNPSKDLYQQIGAPTGANKQEIEVAYKKTASTLSASSSPDAKAKLAEAAYAHKVLSNEYNKMLYDEAHIEPSVFAHTFGRTLYVNFSKISPTTFREFAYAVDSASTTPLDSLIIDERGNVGGALDSLTSFFGLFFGANQYAFDLYHQGEYQVQRTDPGIGYFGELAKFREIAILTDGLTQSSAEVIAATLKRFHIAKIVGVRTCGWGSVENTYPISTAIDPAASYALFLVNSLTLRDDNQPIEGAGVTPDVDTGKVGWQKKLPAQFNSPSLISAISRVMEGTPLR